MADNSKYTGGVAGGPDANMRRSLPGQDANALPVVSTELDSVRSYQWEIEFDVANVTPLDTPQGAMVMDSRALTLAAKQVTGLSYAFKDIEVHRMNDLVYYPGKVTHEEVTVTFDNLLQSSPGRQFYEYLATVFDMRTGFYQAGGADGTTYKTTMRIYEFDGAGRMQNVIELKGVYPKSFTKGEKNYAQSEFDTFEVKFRYDFMNLRAPFNVT